MLASSVLKSSLRIALLAGVTGLAFARGASAQEYDRYGPPPPPPAYQDTTTDEITVYAPRHRHEERSAIGAPIEDVS